MKIASRRDLKQLCEVCTRLHDIAIPHLYRSLVLSSPELSLENFVTILGAIPSKYLKYTQDFGFSVPIHERVESRCVHHGGNGPLIDGAVWDGLAESLTNDGNLDYEDMDGGDTAEGADKVSKGTCFTTFTLERKVINKPAQGRIGGSLFNLSFALDSLKFPDDQLRSFR